MFQITHEFNATAIVDLILRTINIKTRMGEKFKSISRKILGDIDLHVMMEKIHYLIEAKYEMEDVFKGLEQLIDYLLNNEEAVLKFINEHRKKFKLEQTAEIYLLAVNFKKQKKGTARFIDSFIGIPYQHWDPTTPRNEAEDATMKKFWFKHMQCRGISYDELKLRFKDKLQGKAVW